MVLSIYFHNPTPQGLKKTIRLLRVSGFVFISLDHLITQIATKSFSHKRQAFLSFDDGWLGNLELLPILEEFNVPATVFVAVEPVLEGNFWWEYVRRDMNHRQLQQLKRGNYDVLLKQVGESKSRHELLRSAVDVQQLKQLAKHELITIGSHTMTHPLLDKISQAELEHELYASKQELQRMTGCDIKSFSYPNGNYGLRELESVKKYYDCAFTTHSGYIKQDVSVYEIPRICLTGNFVKDILKMSRIWPWLKAIVNHN